MIYIICIYSFSTLHWFCKVCIYLFKETQLTSNQPRVGTHVLNYNTLYYLIIQCFISSDVSDQNSGVDPVMLCCSCSVNRMASKNKELASCFITFNKALVMGGDQGLGVKNI